MSLGAAGFDFGDGSADPFSNAGFGAAGGGFGAGAGGFGAGAGSFGAGTGGGFSIGAPAERPKFTAKSTATREPAKPLIVDDGLMFAPLEHPQIRTSGWLEKYRHASEVTHLVSTTACSLWSPIMCLIPLFARFVRSTTVRRCQIT